MTAAAPMRSIALSLVFLAGSLGCSKDNTQPITGKLDPSDTEMVAGALNHDPEYLPDVNWPEVSMPPGEAWLKCDWGEKQPTPIVDMSAQALLPMMFDCLQGLKITNFELTYKGEIGEGFTDLIARMNELARRFDVSVLAMSIDSGGGDVAEAMRVGDILAKRNWHVVVAEDASCYSACVLVLAAGNVRAISGRVGIHRIIPVESSARSRDQLNDELSDIHDRITIYFAKNGVAKTISDLMMTVPAGDIRILSRQELKDYGLWWTNAAQADLARLEMMKRCGKDYVIRRDEFIRSKAQCDSGERNEKGFSAYSACIDALAMKLGIPDPMCPESPSNILIERGPSG